MPNKFIRRDALMRTSFLIFGLALILTLVGIGSAHASGGIFAQGNRPRGEPPKLLDISGLVWIQDDLFLAVSDAKRPDENDLTRVSFLTQPNSLDGIGFQPLSPRFPGGISSDLESATGIPGTNKLLLIESSDEDGRFQRIFLGKVKTSLTWSWRKNKYEGRRLRILDKVEWGSFTGVTNVEASAVAETTTGSGLIFIWAERNSGEQFTTIKWTDLDLQPFAIGGNGVSSTLFTLSSELVDQMGRPLYSRSIVAMDIDSEGNIYTVAAFDPEGQVETPDNGPFRSAVFKIGKVIAGDVVLDATPTVQAVLDGLKVESIAVRENGNGVELFIGSDDEYYGGILRLLPSP